jgi:hypothetical protein
MRYADICGSGSATLVNGNASHLFLVLHEDLLQSDNLIFVRLALGLENFSKGALADFCNFLIPIAKEHADTFETSYGTYTCKKRKESTAAALSLKKSKIKIFIIEEK